MLGEWDKISEQMPTPSYKPTSYVHTPRSVHRCRIHCLPYVERLVVRLGAREFTRCNSSMRKSLLREAIALPSSYIVNSHSVQFKTSIPLHSA